MIREMVSSCFFELQLDDMFLFFKIHYLYVSIIPKQLPYVVKIFLYILYNTPMKNICMVHHKKSIFRVNIRE